MKKKIIILVGSILLISLIIFGIIFIPKYLEKRNINKMVSEIELVNNYLNGKKNNYDEINDYLKTNTTNGNMNDLELSIENYLNDFLIKYNEIKALKIDNLFINDISADTLSTIKTNKDKIELIGNELDEIISKKDSYLKDIKYQELYHELINKIEFNYQDTINDYSNKMDLDIVTLEFLNNDKNWKIEDEKIIFTKRSSYDAYHKLNSSIFPYELIKDNKAPVITASNITINKGTKINLQDKVSCNDEVDGKVECKISGSYDINKKGDYNIKITSSDKSGNKNEKSIKLTVKEEVVKKNPYYIEVIRNQNVVIVYGLDSNNNYTKIVKVFVCSVGKDSSKTPTGTFKTSDKSKWGWLVGNVYGQYYTRIVGSILFHSVPYYKKDKSTLEWEEYNKLGSPASKGCVRLSVRDVKWIYDNCPKGTTVKIYDGNLPSGVSKPSAIKIDGDSPNKGWDPTDPDSKNPWKK